MAAPSFPELVVLHRQAPGPARRQERSCM